MLTRGAMVDAVVPRGGRSWSVLVSADDEASDQLVHAFVNTLDLG